MSEPADSRPATPLGILGILLGLFVIVGLGMRPFQKGDRPLSDDSAVTGTFGPEAAPLGWPLHSATRLADGREIYLYRDPDAAPPLALPEDPPAPPKPPEGSQGSSGGGRKGRGGRGGGGDWQRDKKKWTRLAFGEANQPPREVALVKLPIGRAEEELRRMFQGLEYRDLEDVGDDGGDVPVDAGRFDWSIYEAPFIRVRHLREEDDERATFHETIRINLTLGRDPWMAILVWDERLQGELDWAKEAVAFLRPTAVAAR